MSKTIDIEMVRRIGKLARIELTDAEADRLTAELGSTLEYFDKLQQLDTEGVEPMAHAVTLNNVLAADVPQPGLGAEQALANAPQRDGDFFRVPKVIGESQ